MKQQSECKTLTECNLDNACEGKSLETFINEKKFFRFVFVTFFWATVAAKYTYTHIRTVLDIQFVQMECEEH